jgi:nucleoside-diphosphate-sugar epimerase
MKESEFIVGEDDKVLVTGAGGFIGSSVVEKLLEFGFQNIRCLVRASGDLSRLKKLQESFPGAKLEVIRGNLLSRDDCVIAAKDVAVVYHLAAGRGVKSYPDAFMNSVVTTRNLLDAVVKSGTVKRFVNVSSLTVYSNRHLKRGALLDEGCEIENHPELRGEAYCYAKVRQEDIISEYNRQFGLPYVILRPGVVYGRGNKGLTGRIGITTFGLFLHLGGSNIIPLSYVENCADAIVLAGIKKGVDGQVFNVVDDNLPTSRAFLRLYRENVEHFQSIFLPKSLSYLLSCLWEWYSGWSKGQLPPVFNRRRWASDWKGNTYSNEKLKRLLGWTPQVPFDEAARRFFAYSREIRESK